MNAFVKNSTFCKSSHKLIYVKIYINQFGQNNSPFYLEIKTALQIQGW